MSQYAMSTKKGDYRVIVWHPGVDENTDYIKISTADAEAVMAKTKTGPDVIREMFMKSRMAEVGPDSAASLVSPPAASAPEIPEKKPDVAPVPAGSAPAGGLPPSNEPNGNEDPPLDFTKLTVSGLSTLLVRDLHAFSKIKGVKFPFGAKKDEMIALLAAKMQEAPEAPAGGPVTE
jgi:hypothetical protein